MAYFNKIEKLVIQKITGTAPEKIVILGELLLRDLFKAFELALFIIPREGTDYNCIVYARDDREFKTQFEKLTSVMALIRRLEINRMIYTVPLLDSIPRLFYEYVDVKATYEIENSKIPLLENQYIKLEGNKLQDIYDVNGKKLLKCYSVNQELNRDLSLTFCSLVYATSELKELVYNGFKTREELQHEEIMVNANTQLKNSKWAVWCAVISTMVAIITLIVSIRTFH